MAGWTLHAAPSAQLGRPDSHPWRHHVIVTFVWALVLAVTPLVHPPEVVRDAALSVHIIGLTLGLGPIVLIDWYGLVWIAGLRQFRDTLRLAEASHPVIWLGVFLLLASGMFLEPDLHSRLTWVKQGLVLVLLNNGIAVRSLGRSLRRAPAPHTLADLHWHLRYRAVGTLITSQVSWWVAAVIGFITSSQRRNG